MLLPADRGSIRPRRGDHHQQRLTACTGRAVHDVEHGSGPVGVQLIDDHDMWVQTVEHVGIAPSGTILLWVSSTASEETNLRTRLASEGDRSRMRAASPHTILA